MSERWYEIHPGTEMYYERASLADAIADMRTQVLEWDYHEDPHGYCHERPYLVRLLDAIAAQSPE